MEKEIRVFKCTGENCVGNVPGDLMPCIMLIQSYNCSVLEDPKCPYGAEFKYDLDGSLEIEKKLEKLDIGD